MIRFAHSEYLHLLTLVPALILLFWLAAHFRLKALARFGDLNILGRLAESASKVKLLLKFVVFLFALMFLGDVLQSEFNFGLSSTY